ncbi:MAG: response regulator [Rhodospirillaceae bacterium]
MTGRLRFAVPTALAVAMAVGESALPGVLSDGPPLGLVSGVLAGTVLTRAWPGLVGCLGVLVAVLVARHTPPLAWLTGVVAPLAAAGAVHAWTTAKGMIGAPKDALVSLGVGAGTGLVAAVLAVALDLPGGPAAWGLAQGLGVLVVAPSLASLLERLAPKPAPVFAPPSGVRVLVVEDDAVNRIVAMEMLRTAGHEVNSAADGLEGVARIARDEPPYDVVLLDLHMPVLDGADALRRIRELPDRARSGVPAILLSADVTEAARKRGRDAGADAFLTKPFEAADLFAVLKVVRSGSGSQPVQSAALPPSADAVDLQLLEGRLGDLGIDSLARILGLFQDAAPRHLSRLREYAEAGDTAALRREAHTLMGAAAVIGAKRVCDAAAGIEKVAGDPVAVLAALKPMKDIIAATLVAVETFAIARNVPFCRRPVRDYETSGAKT